MNVQWFPGHMTKALRLMEENLRLADVIGYVLDARAPAACLNPSFAKLTDGKPCVFILNKSDLADSAKVALWCDYFKQANFQCVTISATDLSQANKITLAFARVAAVNEKYKQKGVFKPTRAMIIGVPNCGKSTVINCLSGKKSTVTGDKPGVTKGKQWVRLNCGVELLDTPGTLWPKFEDEQLAMHLCYVGSIKDDVVDTYELAISLLGELSQLYPQFLQSRYGVELTDNSAVLLERIAAKRGYVVKGGQLDVERCAKAVLDDFRKGKIGKITLEVPK